MNTFHRTTTALLTIIVLLQTLSEGDIAGKSANHLVAVETPNSNPVSTLTTTPHQRVLIGAHVVFGADEEDRELTESVIEAFHKARLPLPDLTIYFYDDLADCDGFGGLYRRNVSFDRVDVCAHTRRHNVLRHEFAHAWEAHAIDDTTREAFMTLQGLSSWFDPEIPWEARGGEQAADTIASGVLDRPYPNLHIPAIDELESSGPAAGVVDHSRVSRIKALPKSIGFVRSSITVSRTAPPSSRPRIFSRSTTRTSCTRCTRPA